MMAKKKRTEQRREGRGREKRRGGAGRAEREYPSRPCSQWPTFPARPRFLAVNLDSASPNTLPNYNPSVALPTKTEPSWSGHFPKASSLNTALETKP